MLKIARGEMTLAILSIVGVATPDYWWANLRLVSPTSLTNTAEVKWQIWHHRYQVNSWSRSKLLCLKITTHRWSWFWFYLGLQKLPPIILNPGIKGRRPRAVISLHNGRNDEAKHGTWYGHIWMITGNDVMQYIWYGRFQSYYLWFNHRTEINLEGCTLTPSTSNRY